MLGSFLQMPTLASCSLDEMIDAAIEGQTQFLQLSVADVASLDFLYRAGADGFLPLSDI